MSQELTNIAIQNFYIAERSASTPGGVTLSGVIPPKVILEVAFQTKSAASFSAGGLKNLATSISHIEKKLDLIMQKLGIPNTLP